MIPIHRYAMSCFSTLESRNKAIKDRLDEILDTMNIPEKRKDDYDWLLRNLHFRNIDHDDFEEAMYNIKLMRGAK